MRSGKGKRKADSSPPSSPSNASNVIRPERTIWISKDNGDPSSPLSVERIQRRVRARSTKVARVKTKKNTFLFDEKRKEPDPESTMPFFIDKTPTVIREVFSKKKDCNDSVIVLDSPISSSHVGNILQHDRKDSVDTVDLCSDSEEEQEVNKRKNKSRRKTTRQATNNLNENVSNIDSPDIIVLDDEEERASNVCEGNASIIMESVSSSVVSEFPRKKRKKNSSVKTTSTSTHSLPSSPKTRSVTCSTKSTTASYISLNPSTSSSMPDSNSHPVVGRNGTTDSQPSSNRNTSFDETYAKRGCDQPVLSNALSHPGPSNFVVHSAPNICLDPSLVPTGLGQISTAMTDGTNSLNCNPTFIRKLPDENYFGFSENNLAPMRNNLNENNYGKSNIGSNVFNPFKNVEQTGLRPIIIDGCNVAIAHGGDRIFSVRGLCICVEYFLSRGHTHVLAIVPLHHRCKVSPRDRDILESLRYDQHLVYTPSRFIDNRLISSYDDRYIVQYAAAVGGVIVSRDNYRDLLHENPAWKDTILNRLLMPTWVGDMLMFPVDPLGKKGPTLDEFLSFPKK